jgi:serpin B
VLKSKQWFLLAASLLALQACGQEAITEAPKMASPKGGLSEVNADFDFDDDTLPEAYDPIRIELSPLAQKQVDGYNLAALRLYGTLAKAKGDIFFSPASLTTALAMAQPGAAGATAEEFKAFLGNNGDEAATQAQGEILQKSAFHVQGRTLAITNSVWADDSLQLDPAYIQQIAKAYQADVNRVNFIEKRDAARTAINIAAAKGTYGRITNFLGPENLTEATRLILLNTAFFRARWRSEFNEELTSDEPFYAADGTKPKVPMMRDTRNMGYYAGNGFQAVSLPYEQGETEMLLFLPDKKQALVEMEAGLSPERYAIVLAALSKDFPEVELSFPKYRMQQRGNFAKVFQQLGMASAFDPPTANFAIMVSAKPQAPLFLAQLVHEARIEVDEQGTEAAAATAIDAAAAAADMGPPPKPKIFKADHPFLFMIRDVRSGLILFMGRYTGANAEAG